MLLGAVPERGVLGGQRRQLLTLQRQTVLRLLGLRALDGLVLVAHAIALELEEVVSRFKLGAKG